MSLFYYPTLPHIHIHLLFDDTEAFQFHYTAHEFCCHVCHAAHTVFVDFAHKTDTDEWVMGISESDQLRAHALFSQFLGAHRNCPSEEKSVQLNEAVMQVLSGKSSPEILCPETRGATVLSDLRVMGYSVA